MPRSTFGNGGLEALQYTGGHTVTCSTTGYVKEYCPEYPACNLRGHVPQARLVMELHLGRFLSGQEVVHHQNEDKSDNRLENLRLFENNAAHMRFHRLESLTKGRIFLARLRCLAKDPQMSIRRAARKLKCSIQSVHTALGREKIPWVEQRSYPELLHTHEEVLQTLRTHPRKEAEKILGMTSMSLWRHFPAEMNTTARRKSLKGGGRLGGTVKSGLQQKRPRNPYYTVESDQLPVEGLLMSVPIPPDEHPVLVS